MAFNIFAWTLIAIWVIGLLITTYEDPDTYLVSLLAAMLQIVLLFYAVIE